VRISCIVFDSVMAVPFVSYKLPLEILASITNFASSIYSEVDSPPIAGAPPRGRRARAVRWKGIGNNWRGAGETGEDGKEDGLLFGVGHVSCWVQGTPPRVLQSRFLFGRVANFATWHDVDAVAHVHDVTLEVVCVRMDNLGSDRAEDAYTQGFGNGMQKVRRSCARYGMDSQPVCFHPLLLVVVLITYAAQLLTTPRTE